LGVLERRKGASLGYKKGRQVVAKSQRQGTVAKVEVDLRLGVDRYKLKEIEEDLKLIP
jgi:hypothetical protein